MEDEQITASSIFSEDYPPHKARLGGMEWCAQEGLGIGAWIQVDFRENIIIQELQIEGDGGEFQYYLTQFTIEYGPNSDQLSSILQPNSFQPMVFTRPDSPSVSTTVLPNPLTTQILRIVGVAFFGGAVLCLDLEAIGCVLPLGKLFSIIIYTQRAYTVTPQILLNLYFNNWEIFLLTNMHTILSTHTHIQMLPPQIPHKLHQQTSPNERMTL